MNFNMEKLMNFNTIVDDTNGAHNYLEDINFISWHIKNIIIQSQQG